MDKIFSELTPYDQLVDAMYQEITTKESTIIWSVAVKNKKDISPTSVMIGDTPAPLLKLGFEDKIVYDLEHFVNNMKNRDYAHGHEMSPQDMKRILDVLSNPVVIASDDIKQDTMGHEYKPLVFFTPNPKKSPTSEQTYMKVVVQPADFHNGTVEFGYASKIITYYETNERYLNNFLEDIAHGKRNLMFFNSELYKEIDSPNKKEAFLNKETCISQNPEDCYTSIDSLNNRVFNHRRDIKAVIAVELDRTLNHQFGQYETYHAPIQMATELVRDKNASIYDLVLARDIMEKAAEIVQDVELERKVMKYIDDKILPKLKEKAPDFIEGLKIENEDDRKMMWKLVDKIAPMNKPQYQDLQNTLCDIAGDKEDRFYEGIEYK